MEYEPHSYVWTFTGLYNVDMGGHDQVELGAGFFLSKPTPSLLSVRSRVDLSGRQFDEMEAVHCFLIHRESLPLLRGPERYKKIERFQNGLMALQILKPLATFGFIFQGAEQAKDRLNLETTCQRTPMNPGEWARMRPLDSQLISQLPDLIAKVLGIMRGKDVERKNAIFLLQHSLEHHHPLLAGLFAVMGMEALFDSQDREQFRNRLCDCLGPTTLAFPDWKPDSSIPRPTYSVGEIAIHLYTLRSKISHGVDLRQAVNNRKYPIDLLKRVSLVPSLPERQYAVLLSEAALYLLCQVLQRKIWCPGASSGQTTTLNRPRV